MLSVQNMHLVQDENTVVHAAARGGRRGGRRPSARGGSAGRWALGAGAATAGLAIMASRNKTVRRFGAKVRRSKVLKGVRKAVLTRVRAARGTATGLGVRRFVQARKTGARKITASGRAAIDRIYASAKARIAAITGSGRSVGTRVKNYVTGVSKRANLTARRVTGKAQGRGRPSSRGSGGRKRR